MKKKMRQIRIISDVATCMPNHNLYYDWLRITQIYGVPKFEMTHLFFFFSVIILDNHLHS